VEVLKGGVGVEAWNLGIVEHWNAKEEGRREGEEGRDIVAVCFTPCLLYRCYLS
jgi:hypothetical protein